MAVISVAREREAYITRPEIKKYTVWVEGKEMTTGFVNYETAKLLHKVYTKRGYEDVVINKGRKL